MGAIKNYLSLIKFAHTIFAMPFALIGFSLGITSYGYLNSFLNQNQYEWFHGQVPDFSDYPSSIQQIVIRFLLIIGCMIFARSAAMAFNRYLDAEFDKKNPRTVVREIPAGIIKPANALLFVIINCIAFIACCWFINRLCFYLSFVALFVVLFYSYTKRFTALCHLVLGVGLGLAPIGAYIAVTGSFAVLPLLFSFAVLFWVSGFDIIYALQDEEFDKHYQLHSIPAAVGKKGALRISEILHFLSAACVIFAGYYGHFGYWYIAGAAFFTALLIYQHLLAKPTDLSKVNMAFFTTNGIASVVFAVFVLVDIFCR